MKKLWIFPAVLIAFVIIFTLVHIRPVKDQANETATIQPTDPAPQTIGNSDIHETTDSRLARLPDDYVEYLPALETSRAFSKTNSTKEALSLIEQLLGHYRFAYKENPVGVENFEITEQLLGKNPKKIVFIASDSTALRGNELVDQWGTPYFFHAWSGQEMDILSAGPDQTLWTTDDITTAKSNQP